ncbi:MAG: mechanosensitive ion channel [Xenococcaceae cyanobacterium MO_207.B15]|nr:mechanosensitive ion channel [Xenococcaceae cyanobacterium MO_207.B15]
MLIKKYLTTLLLGLLIAFLSPVNSVLAQFPTIQDLVFYSNDLINNNSGNNAVAACIRLDGRCLFRLAFPKSDLTERINEVQYRLNNVKDLYLKSPQKDIQITLENRNNILNIYVQINNNQIRLMSVTQADADIRGLSLNSTGEQIVEQLEEGLLKAKSERTSQFLIRQGIISILILVLVIVGNSILLRWEKKIQQNKQELEPSQTPLVLSLFSRLERQKNWHFQEIKYRLVQLLRLSIAIGGLLYILGLFPQTRTIQLILVTAIRLPVRVTAIIFISYFGIRLAYALINRISSELISSQLLSPKANRRFQLRINTIATVAKSILAILGITIGITISLGAIGVNVTPFLAGAGIIGLALSFASQNLIKDAINGFLIIIEDQYAVGDIINVGAVTGLVENINLRITQIRDAEGRLITIPNSEVRIVANLSSQWSRADLTIPISYDIDVNSALELITQVADLMTQDEQWQHQILEAPQILGVDKFSDRGTLIRVWIKTEPLKQWEVSREFRRRIKIAFDNAGMPIQPPQQQIWLKGIENKDEGLRIK